MSEESVVEKPNDITAEENASEAPQMSPLRRWVRRFLIVALVIAALFVAGLIMASAMGTHSAVRLGMQDYLSEVSNSRVTISRYDKAAFYPSLDVDIGQIAFLGSTSPVSGARIGSVRLKMRFWDVFFGRPRAQILDMKEVFLPAGYFTRDALTIEAMKLTRESALLEGKPGFTVSGRLGEDKPFTLAAEMTTVSQNMKPTYFTYPGKSRFVMESPSITMRGALTRADNGGIAMEFSDLGFPDHGWEGTADALFYPEKNLWQFDLSRSTSRLTGAITIDEQQVTGTVKAPVITVADLAILPDFITFLSDTLPARFLEGRESSVTIEIAKLAGTKQETEPLIIPLRIKDNQLILDHKRFLPKPEAVSVNPAPEKEMPKPQDAPEYNQ